MALNTLTPDQLVQLVAQSRISLLDDPPAWMGSEEPFYVADIGQVYRQHQRWLQNLLGVRPFYGIYAFCPHGNTNLMMLSCQVQSGPDFITGSS